MVPGVRTVHFDVAFLGKLVVGHEDGEDEWVLRISQRGVRWAIFSGWFWDACLHSDPKKADDEVYSVSQFPQRP